MRAKRFIIAITILTLFSCAHKKEEDIITQIKPTGYVNDFANVLSDNVQMSLEKIITDFEKASSIEIAVVTLPYLDNHTIEDAAVTIFERWGIGKKGKDNGILFLVAIKERKLRIEVGYGLEGTIPDSLAGRIRDIYAVPYLKDNDYNRGITATTLALITIISKKQGIDFKTGIEDRITVPSEKKNTVPIIPLLLLLAFLFRFGLWWIFPFFFMGSGGSGYSGRGFGGFSGGFSGFGGGMSGGGGASGSF